MGWFFAQLWFLLLLAFLVGSALATLVVHLVSTSVEELARQARLRGRGAR